MTQECGAGMKRGGLRERAMRSALARSLAPSCQQDSCQYRPSRKIKEVVRSFPHRAQRMSWASIPYCIALSDLTAVLSLVAAHGSYVITPTGKPPPLAVRLAEALPFRRAAECSREPPFNEPPRSLGRRFSCETGKANLTS